MEWAETLPENCPPPEAIRPYGERFYRLIESVEPDEYDFFSHRKRYPDKVFNTNECKALSLSVFSTLKECKKILLLPNNKDKKIVEIELTEESGVILKTGKSSKHYSWWLAKDFNPLNNCTIVSDHL